MAYFAQFTISLKTEVHFEWTFDNLLVVFMRTAMQRISPYFSFRLNHSECMSVGRKYELPSYFRTIEWHCCDNDRIYDKHSPL